MSDSINDRLSSGEIVSSGQAARILETERLASAKPGFIDRMIHAEYESEFGRMATFGKKSAKLPETTILK